MLDSFETTFRGRNVRVWYDVVAGGPILKMRDDVDISHVEDARTGEVIKIEEPERERIKDALMREQPWE